MLNAFRHHRGGHGSLERRPGAAWTVLNAFRHHRGGHISGSTATWAVTKCSTPFGITEGGMDGGASRRARRGAQRLSASQRGASAHDRATITRISAQRLSASQRGAYRRTRLGRIAIRCSTPFGITEGGIREHVARNRPGGCSTPFGITEGGIRSRPGLPDRHTGAQRLSASQRGA